MPTRFHCASTGLRWTLPQCRELFAIYAGHGSKAVLKAMESKYRLDAKTVLGPAIRLEKKEAVYVTFRLNFHRFDRFELDPRGHTRP